MRLVGVSIKVIFFDLDGTLTDIFKREVYAIHDTANHFGLKVSRAQVKKLLDKVAIGWREIRSYSDVFRALGLTLTDQVVEYWTSAFLKRYRLSNLRRGAKSTLKTLSRSYKLFCVTSRESLAEVKLELDFLRLEKSFDYIVTREVAAKHFRLNSLPFTPFQEQRKKLYECALAMANCHPNEVLVVGDMASELKPAKEIGMKTIGLLTEKGKEPELRKVSDYLIPSITDLKRILRGKKHPLEREHV